MKLVSANKVGEFENQDVIEYVFSGINTDYKILNLGCIIKGIYRKNKEGIKENIVLAYEDIKDYYENKSYYGAVIGRTSGRIYDGKLSINEKEINFNKNYEVSQCHGGNKGFNKKIWNGKVIEDNQCCKLEFTYLSKDGEENYPGNLNIKVTYTLKEDELSFETEGVSDSDTIVNLTNHSYFNLTGNYKASVMDEILTMNSDYYLAIDENSCPTGEKIPTKDSAFDFNEEKAIGKDIDKEDKQIILGNGYDHCFLFNEKEAKGKIKLTDKTSGIVMDIETDNPAVVIYTMNFPDGIAVEGGKVLDKRYAICFECQNPPIGKNQSFKEYSLIKANEKYKRKTSYKFSTIV